MRAARVAKRKRRIDALQRARGVAAEQGYCVLRCARAMYCVKAMRQVASLRPCGHECACVPCVVAQPLRRCPLCRKGVEAVVFAHDGSAVPDLHDLHDVHAVGDMPDEGTRYRYEEHVAAQRQHERITLQRREIVRLLCMRSFKPELKSFGRYR